MTATYIDTHLSSIAAGQDIDAQPVHDALLELDKLLSGNADVEQITLEATAYEAIDITNASDTASTIQGTVARTNANFGFGVVGRMARVSGSTEEAIQNGDKLFHIKGEGHNGTGYETSAQIWLTASEAWSTGNQGSKIEFRTTANTTTSQSTMLTIKGDGTVIGGELEHTGSALGFYNSTPVAKQTVTGSRGGNAALASLLTALDTIGLITDSSS